jgi:hypothetical protein
MTDKEMELRAKIAELEAENIALREDLLKYVADAFCQIYRPLARIM